jgi:hypothetical protein
MPELGVRSIKQFIQKIDWKLLLFLILFLNVKIVVKLAAIILIYLLRWNFRFGIKVQDSRLPLFYITVIVIAAITYISLLSHAPANYAIVFIIGIGFWCLSILAMHQMKLAVEENATITLHNTLLVFFIINIIASLVNVTSIIAEIHTVNPYRYQGQYQKYFINTGDYIKGITFDTSTTNAIINAFGVAYFLVRKNVGMTLACMAVLLLTASNFTNIILLMVLTFLFIFKSSSNQRSVILICFAMLVVFLSKVSPQNDQYVMESFKNFISPNHVSAMVLNSKPVTLQEKPDNQLTPEERKKKIALLFLDSLDRISVQKNGIKTKGNSSLIASMEDKVIIPEPSIHTPPFQSKKDTTPFQWKLLNFISSHKSQLNLSTSAKEPKLPGKAIAAKEAFTYLQKNPREIIAGTGIGNFSSKLAFRATALNIEGSYLERYKYVSSSFLQNHFDVYLYYFTRHSGSHSLTNTPNSVYIQLLTEYGLLGIMAFFITYVGFFLQDYKKLTYGILLLFIMLSAFAIDYWFEQLSIAVLFELMIFLNIKENHSTANA